MNATTDQRTAEQIREDIESFLSDWDRATWMADHGVWASSAWDDHRTVHTAACAAIASVLGGLDNSDALADLADLACNVKDVSCDLPCTSDIASLREAIETLPESLRETLAPLTGAVLASAEALLDSVPPDEADYIATGVIDPDGVEGDAEPVGVSRQWDGWDCREGWQAVRHGGALYVNWYRSAWGHRHERDLYVLVDGEYFEADDD